MCHWKWQWQQVATGRFFCQWLYFWWQVAVGVKKAVYFKKARPLDGEHHGRR